jgi:Putative Ig domain
MLCDKPNGVSDKSNRNHRMQFALLAILASAFMSTGCSTLFGSSSSPAGTPSSPQENSRPKAVVIQLSPQNVTVPEGGKVQFAATLANTSQTGVKWSSSAGSISSTGLLTAPSNPSIKSITVTAQSIAANTVAASATVAVAPGDFVIDTASLPPAADADPYTASLLASGGQPPYQWNIAAGSLPAGLKFGASTGTISGTATQSGTFPLIVLATDALSHTAQRSLSLTVSTSKVGTCGPPTYACSRTNLAIVQLPAAPPNVGNLSGANTIVTDPDFDSPIVRITDANTNPEATFQNRTYVSSSSGSADVNVWNVDSTLFVAQDTGANTYPFTFNPSTMRASRMYVSSFASTNGLVLNQSGEWSRVNPNLFYTFSGTAINKYDFTDRTTPPSSQPFYSFTSSSNCLPPGFTAQWIDEGGVSGDDTVFGVAYSNSGGQGTGIYVVTYKVGSGCSMLNTQTGQVSGDWGLQGKINIADRWTIHNVKLSKDGNWMVIVSTTCLSPTCATQPYFWQIGTTTVNSCGDGGSCSGHWTEGYSHWVNNDNSPMANQVIRLFSPATSVGNLIGSFPAGITVPFDQHQSWNNVDPNDSVPFLSTTWSTTSPFPAPWYNEVIAVAADGSGTTWRFAHTFITTRSQRFSTQYAIGSVSQDGRFFLLSSDWMGTLGSESGSATCTIGTNCRGDVFVVALQ